MSKLLSVHGAIQGIFEISIAGKAQYILASQKRGLTHDELQSQAGRFGSQTDKAVHFLPKMDLVERTYEEAPR